MEDLIWMINRNPSSVRAIVQEGECCGGTTFPNNRRNPGATPGDLHRVEDSLGWQNRLIDKASVQFRLTTRRIYHNGISFLRLKNNKDEIF